VSFAPVTPPSPSGGQTALQQGYAAPPPNPERIVCAPWTQRDIHDMENIQGGLGWLMDEIKSGHALTEERHGFTLRSVIAASLALAEKERTWREKYDPHQPRVPAGHTDGGQSTDAGTADRGGGVTLPRRKPSPAIAKPHPHVDSPYYNPATGIYDPPLNPTWSPFDFIGLPAKPAAGAIAGGTRAAYNQARLQRYLAEARQIPKDVREAGKGTENLTTGQMKRLTEFKSDRSKHKDNIEIINYSDGRAIFSVKQPAKKIPKSYTVWEHQVDAVGSTIRRNKTTVGPDGELIHIKPYGNH
jgi:hypothetical protein